MSAPKCAAALRRGEYPFWISQTDGIYLRGCVEVVELSNANDIDSSSGGRPFERTADSHLLSRRNCSSKIFGESTVFPCATPAWMLRFHPLEGNTTMRTREEIERRLRKELERARQAHEQAKEAFKDIGSHASSGLLHPNGRARIAKGRRALSAAMEAYSHAIREFDDFILDGKIPERLKACGKKGSQPPDRGACGSRKSRSD